MKGGSQMFNEVVIKLYGNFAYFRVHCDEVKCERPIVVRSANLGLGMAV